MKIEKKITLTENELKEIIISSYLDGFEYSEKWEEIWKKRKNSQGRDVLSYARKKIKEMMEK